MPKDIKDQLEALQEGQEDQLKKQAKLEKQIGKLTENIGTLGGAIEKLVKSQGALGNSLKTVVTRIGALSTNAKKAATNTGAMAEGVQDAAGAVEELADAHKKANSQANAASKINAKNLAVINKQTEAIVALSEEEAAASGQSKKNDEDGEKRRKRGIKGYKETKEEFEKLIESTKAFDKIHGLVLKKASEHTKGFREGIGKNATGMVALGAAAIYAAKKMGELAKEFREGMIDFAKFNVEQATMAELDIIAPGGLKQLEDMRKNLSMTTKQFSEFRGVLEEGVMSGVASLGNMEDAAIKLRESFGGAQLDKLKNYVDLLKEMPNLDTDLKITASFDDQAASWFALAQQGKVSQAIELQSAGLLGGAGGEEKDKANTDILNQAQTTDAKIENIERGLYEWLPSWGPSFATIAEKTSSAAESLIGVAGLAVGLMMIFRKPPPNVADLSIKTNTDQIVKNTAAIAAQGSKGGAGNLAVKTGGKGRKDKGGGVKGAVAGVAATVATSVVVGAVSEISPAAAEVTDKLGDVAGTMLDFKDATGISLKGVKQWGAGLLKNNTLYTKGILKITTTGAGMATGFALAGVAALYYGKKLTDAGAEQMDGVKKLRKDFVASGNVIEDYDNQMAMHEDAMSSTTKKIGGSLLKGAAAGALFGATVGSVVPVFGTAIGAAIGGLAGLFIVSGDVQDAFNERADEETKYGESLKKLRPTIDSIKKSHERLRTIMRGEEKTRQRSALSMQMYIKATKTITEVMVAAQDEIQKFGQLKLANFEKLGGSVEDFNTTIVNTNKAIADRFDKIAEQTDKLRQRILSDSTLMAEDRKNTLMMINKVELEAAQKFADAILEMADVWQKSPQVQEMRKRAGITERRLTANQTAGGALTAAGTAAQRKEQIKQKGVEIEAASRDAERQKQLEEAINKRLKKDEAARQQAYKTFETFVAATPEPLADSEVESLEKELKKQKKISNEPGPLGSKVEERSTATASVKELETRIEKVKKENEERQKKSDEQQNEFTDTLKDFFTKNTNGGKITKDAAYEQIKKITQQMDKEKGATDDYEIGTVMVAETEDALKKRAKVYNDEKKELEDNKESTEELTAKYKEDEKELKKLRASRISEVKSAKLDKKHLKEIVKNFATKEQQGKITAALEQFGEGPIVWSKLAEEDKIAIDDVNGKYDAAHRSEIKFIANRRGYQQQAISSLEESVKETDYTNMALANFAQAQEAELKVLEENAAIVNKQIDEIGKSNKSAEALREMQQADAAATYDYATNNGAENASRRLLATMKKNAGLNDDIKKAGEVLHDTAANIKIVISKELELIQTDLEDIHPSQIFNLSGVANDVKNAFNTELGAVNTELQDALKEAADLRERQMKAIELQAAGKKEEAAKVFTPEQAGRLEKVQQQAIPKNISKQKNILQSIMKKYGDFPELKEYATKLENRAQFLAKAAGKSNTAAQSYVTSQQNLDIKMAEANSALIEDLKKFRDSIDQIDQSFDYQVPKSLKESADAGIDLAGVLWDVAKGQEAVRDANKSLNQMRDAYIAGLDKELKDTLKIMDAAIEKDKIELEGAKTVIDKETKKKKLEIDIANRSMKASLGQKARNTKILEIAKATTEVIKKNADLQISNLEEQKSYLTEYADTLSELGGSVGEIVKVRQQSMQVSYEELAIKRDEVKAMDENIAAMKREQEAASIAGDFNKAATLATAITANEKERFRMAMEYGKKEMQVRKEALGMQRDAYDKLLSKAFGALNANKGAARGIGTDALLFGGSRVVNAKGMTVGGKSSTLQDRQAQMAMGAKPTGLISSMPNIAGVGGTGAVASRSPTEKLENKRGSGLGGTLGAGPNTAANLPTPATQAAIIDKGIDGSQKVSSMNNTLDVIAGTILDIAARFGIVAKKDDKKTTRELKNTRREITTDKKQLDGLSKIEQLGEKGASGVAGAAGVAGVAVGAGGTKGAKGGKVGLSYQQQIGKHQAEKMGKFDVYMKRIEEADAAEAKLTDEERAAKKAQSDEAAFAADKKAAEFSATRKDRIEKTSNETPEERTQRRLDMVNASLQKRKATKTTGVQTVKSATDVNDVGYKQIADKQKELEAKAGETKDQFNTDWLDTFKTFGAKEAPLGPKGVTGAAGEQGLAGSTGPAFMAGKTAPYSPAALTPTAGLQPVSTISANPRGAGAANAPMTLNVDVKGDIKVSFNNEMFKKEVSQIVIQTASTNPAFLQVMNKRYVSMS